MTDVCRAGFLGLKMKPNEVAREVTSQRVGYDVVDVVFAVVLMFWWSTPDITKEKDASDMMPVLPVTS